LCADPRARAGARLILVAFLLLVPSLAAPAGSRLLVAVGDVSASTAVLWARGPAKGQLRMDYGPAGDPPTGTASFNVDGNEDLIGKLLLKGLRPATRYAYRVQVGETTVGGEFVTAPVPDDRAPVTFLWSGDLGGSGFCRRQEGGYRIFATMARRRPDFFLFVGDTIYADHRCRGPDVVPGGDFVATTLHEYRRKYLYNREDPVLSAFLAGTSVYAIWDDHEVRNNFAGSTDPLMPVGRQAFLEYWPILPPAQEPTRLYRSARWGRLLEVFILDTRQYRSPNSALDGPAKTMLGEAQRRWLIEEVAASSALWKVVVSSVSLSVSTGKTHRDSWSNASVWGVPEEDSTGFAVERDAILRAWADRGVKNLVFLVSDVHHAELIRHHPTRRFSFHEFIAGPLSASFGRPRALDAGLNPRLLFAYGGVNNFGEVRVEPAHLTVRIVAEDGAVLFTHTIRSE
jgi:alkaline phosphatase D